MTPPCQCGRCQAEATAYRIERLTFLLANTEEISEQRRRKLEQLEGIAVAAAAELDALLYAYDHLVP